VVQSLGLVVSVRMLIEEGQVAGDLYGLGMVVAQGTASNLEQLLIHGDGFVEAREVEVGNAQRETRPLGRLVIMVLCFVQDGDGPDQQGFGLGVGAAAGQDGGQVDHRFGRIGIVFAQDLQTVGEHVSV